MHGQEADAFCKIRAEMARQIFARAGEERVVAAALQFSREACAIITFDLRATEGMQRVGSGHPVRAAEQPRVAPEFIRLVEREIELVCQPKRQSGGGFELVR